MPYEYKHIPVLPETHQRFKAQAAAAGLSFTDYLNYLLNLGKAYPPTIDQKETEQS